MVSFLLQLATFFVIALGYRVFSDLPWAPGINLLALPLLILIMTALAFGCGVLVASLTTRFRDLGFLVGFGMQLLIYASPVIFPLSLVPDGSLLRLVIELNPMTGVIEGFRAALLGTPIDLGLLPYSGMAALVMLIIGTLVFQRAQRTFADVV